MRVLAERRDHRQRGQGAGARAAQAALSALQETGEIEVEIHGAPYPGPRRQYRPNLYRVTVAASLVVHQATPLVPI